MSEKQSRWHNFNGCVRRDIIRPLCCHVGGQNEVMLQLAGVEEESVVDAISVNDCSLSGIKCDPLFWSDRESTTGSRKQARKSKCSFATHSMDDRRVEAH